MRPIILLADDGPDSVVVRQLLENRQVRYSEVHPTGTGPIHRRPETPYEKLPVLFVGGETFTTLKEIEHVINSNEYL